MDIAHKNFPATITKAELLSFYGVSMYMIKKSLGAALLKTLHFDRQRVFSPADTAKIFAKLEPDAFRVFVQTKEKLYEEYLSRTFGNKQEQKNGQNPTNNEATNLYALAAG